jgi:hypothetical protein
MFIKEEIKEYITIQDVINLLNEALELDKSAIKNLIHQKVSCNKKLAEHPTIHVSVNSKNTEFKVSLLGMLNGLFGIADNGMGVIEASYYVICPNGHEIEPNKTIYSRCSICNEQLLIDLVGFKQRGV